MAWQDWIALASLAGVVFAVWLARRKGQARFAASIAAARAEGHAEAKAELTAMLHNQVQIINSGTALPGQSDDPVELALRRVAVDRASDLRAIDHSATSDLRALLDGPGDIGRPVYRDDEWEQLVDRSARLGDSRHPSNGVDGGSA